MASSSKGYIQEQSDKPVSYAGFWERIAAALIDAVIVSVIESLLGLPLLFIAVGQPFTGYHTADVMALVSLASFVVIALSASAYFVFFETSKLQATPGKLALGLRVTDLNGQCISIKSEVFKNFLQYLLYGLILIVSIAVESVTVKLSPRAGMLEQRSALSLLAPLLSLLLGNVLYFVCFFVLIFNERRQTIFDKLTGRLVWSSRPAVEGYSKARVMLGIFIFVYAFAWVSALTRIQTHSRFDLMQLLLIVSLVYFCLIVIVLFLIAISLMRADANGFVRWARTLSALSIGKMRRLWRDRADAMVHYVDGNSNAAEELMSKWFDKLNGRHVDDQLSIRLIGSSIACDTDRIIDTGGRMKQRQIYPPASKLLVASAYFQKRQNKEALELLDTVPTAHHVNRGVLNAYFVSYFARLGYERDLESMFNWLERAKYPVTNDWRLRLQAVCALAKGDRDKARSLFKRALDEVGNKKNPDSTLARFTQRAVKIELAKLDSQPEADVTHSQEDRAHFEQILKRLAIRAGDGNVESNRKGWSK